MCSVQERISISIGRGRNRTSSAPVWSKKDWFVTGQGKRSRLDRRVMVRRREINRGRADGFLVLRSLHCDGAAGGKITVSKHFSIRAAHAPPPALRWVAGGRASRIAERDLDSAYQAPIHDGGGSVAITCSACLTPLLVDAVLGRTRRASHMKDWRKAQSSPFRTHSEKSLADERVVEQPIAQSCSRG